MPTSAKRLATWCAWTVLAAAGSGCNVGQPPISYLGEDDYSDYKSQATEIDYPTVCTSPTEELAASFKPHTISDRTHTEIRDITLAETMHTALMNSEVILTAGTFLSTSNPLFFNSNQVTSVYDPAIQESGVLFGGRGVEAALADFDANFTSQLLFANNSAFTSGLGGDIQQDTGSLQSALTKAFANGSSIEVNNNVNYLNTNAPFTSGPHSYTGQLQALYRQPLLAGAGTSFTRVAGPITRSFGGITGVSQGVLIARINNDITLNDFEVSVRNLLLDVENAYWDLYYSYRQYDTAIVARNSALDAWRLADKQKGEVIIPADEAQARNAYYQARSAAQTAQSNIFTNETRLRRLLGLTMNDGTVLRPLDEPVTAEVVPDWTTCLSDAMSLRVELRRQKWNIKSLELQLGAAKSLTRARLDFIGGYQINGFGTNLFENGTTGGAPNGYYNSLADADQTGWQAGLQMNIPIGFRAQLAQVRNYELRVAKAYKVLAAQELEIGHELAVAFQELDRAYGTMRSNYLRFLAAEDDVRLREPRYKNGEELVDSILRAYERRAQAELIYYQSVVEYNKAIAMMELRRGTLLEYNNVSLSEGYWRPEAYQDAARHAKARGAAFQDDSLYDSPPAFASEVPVDQVQFAPPIVPESGIEAPAVPMGDEEPMAEPMPEAAPEVAPGPPEGGEAEAAPDTPLDLAPEAPLPGDVLQPEESSEEE